MVGPPAYTTTPTPARLAVRDALRAAAAATHSRFVDPLAENWPADARYAGPDNEHPTVAGQQKLLEENGLPAVADPPPRRSTLESWTICRFRPVPGCRAG